ncbi:MAG: ATP-binding protein [Acidobacteriota bacterium]|nr:ATP-binding protein [Acidobacteriota bacterium]
MTPAKKKGPRLVGAVIVLLILLFFTIEFFIRESQEFSPTGVTRILLSSLQIIVILLGLILFVILGRYMAKLYLERKRRVLGAHFRTKLVMFFIALSFIPTVLLFIFASDFVSRNIEHWFQTPLDKILDDTRGLAEGFYTSGEEITLHHAQQLARVIRSRKLIQPENRPALRDFIWEKLKEYQLDEISIFLDDEELFSYLNPNLPLRYYRDLKTNIVKRAQLGEDLRSIEPMGSGEMIRRGTAFQIAGIGNVLVATGKYLPENYAQRISNINSYVQRYRLGKTQKNPVKSFYFMTLVFITLLIIFAASWIGFQLAKSITVPIEKLAHATKEVSRGNLDVRIEDPASDEIGFLIESFNQMTSDLRDSQQNIARQTNELESRKQYIETILNKISTGVIALDGGGTITTINPSAREMLGVSDADVIGRGYAEILGPAAFSEIRKNIDWGMKNKRHLPHREITFSSNGRVTHLALSLSPLRQGPNDFSGLIVVLDDLTQLINTQKIAAWKEVAQRVAHEIKNPLTPIQLSAERIINNLNRDETARPDVIAQGARTIIQEARTIKSLVDEFSNFARMPKIQPQPSHLHAILDQTIALFKGIFSEIDFDVHYAADIPSPISVDPEQLKRAVINILDNAIDAMNKKGRISIVTSFDAAENRVNIAISDSGPGIAVDDKFKLFLPHYSTKKRGTGLGLAIVNQIVQEHNGSVDVENIRPHGAKFILRIPA